MTTYLHRPTGLAPGGRYRVDTGASNGTAATITSVDPPAVIDGSVVRVESNGSVAAFLGSAATLHLRPLNYLGTAGTAVSSTGSVYPVPQPDIGSQTSGAVLRSGETAAVDLSGAASLKLKAGTSIDSQADRTGQLVLHTVNDPGGFIQKSILFIDDGEFSRGGPTWVDSNGRVQLWAGWHDKIPSGSSHHGFEVKGAADPNGPAPSTLVTFFRIKTDNDRTTTSFYSTDLVSIQNGAQRANDQFGIEFVTPASGAVITGDSSGSRTLGEIKVSDNGSGVATMDISAALGGTTSGSIRFGRNSLNGLTYRFLKADGTNTDVLNIASTTGNMMLTGNFILSGTITVGGAASTIRSSAAAANPNVLDLDATPSSGTAGSHVRLFRNVTTSGSRQFRISKGDGTNTDMFVVDASSGDTTIAGNLTVSGTITSTTTFNEMELRRSSQVSSMPRMLATSNLAPTSGTMYSALAFAKSAGTFTKIRLATGTTVTSITDIRIGVHNAAGTLLASTANLSATITTGTTLYDNLTLDTPVTATANQQLWLSIAFTGTTLNLRGASVNAGPSSLAPVMATSATYAGGALPSLGSSNTGNVPWIELVP